MLQVCCLNSSDISCRSIDAHFLCRQHVAIAIMRMVMTATVMMNDDELITLKIFWKAYFSPNDSHSFHANASELDLRIFFYFLEATT